MQKQKQKQKPSILDRIAQRRAKAKAKAEVRSQTALEKRRGSGYDICDRCHGQRTVNTFKCDLCDGHGYRFMGRNGPTPAP